MVTRPRATRVVLRVHQWLGLLVGLQILFWVLGGLVMSALPIERVRGEHHAAALAPAALAPATLIDLPTAMSAAGLTVVRDARLYRAARGAVWLLTSDGGTRVVDARSGRTLAPLGRADVERLAAAAYVGTGHIVAIARHAAAPDETGLAGPLWSVDFDDRERTRLYLAPDTGDVVKRRSSLWRFYDFFWRLHIMNFGDGTDFNHPLLVGTASAALVVVGSGAVLVVSWLRRRRRAQAAARAALRADGSA